DRHRRPLNRPRGRDRRGRGLVRRDRLSSRRPDHRRHLRHPRPRARRSGSRNVRQGARGTDHRALDRVCSRGSATDEDRRSSRTGQTVYGGSADPGSRQSGDLLPPSHPGARADARGADDRRLRLRDARPCGHLVPRFGSAAAQCRLGIDDRHRAGCAYRRSSGTVRLSGGAHRSHRVVGEHHRRPHHHLGRGERVMITAPVRDETADTESSAPILAIEGLHISTEDRPLVHDATISVAAGQAAGLVGESGSGKTLTVRAVAGLLPETFSVGGHIRLLGTDLFDDAGDRPDAAVLTRLRANEVGMVFQSPRAHLNPLRTIGDFLIEGLVSVHGVMRRQATARAVELLEEVGIDHPVRRLRQYPGELSGGLLQRVMIAAALMTDPKLLLADEITTALDVTTQEEVMAVIGDLRRHRNLGMLFITHDLALAGAVCDTVTVMEKGRTIESLEATTMRDNARTEYTRTL